MRFAALQSSISQDFCWRRLWAPESHYESLCFYFEFVFPLSVTSLSLSARVIDDFFSLLSVINISIDLKKRRKKTFFFSFCRWNNFYLSDLSCSVQHDRNCSLVLLYSHSYFLVVLRHHPVVSCQNAVFKIVVKDVSVFALKSLDDAVEGAHRLRLISKGKQKMVVQVCV